mmetsp:Transcript_21841/g.54011  ORF Transcript_21841/g.54011 Transcript_21841/m.54011 type:complete len:206 (+) Transcript_21841:510-1127(+)
MVSAKEYRQERILFFPNGTALGTTIPTSNLSSGKRHWIATGSILLAVVFLLIFKFRFLIGPTIVILPTLVNSKEFIELFFHVILPMAAALVSLGTSLVVVCTGRLTTTWSLIAATRTISNGSILIFPTPQKGIQGVGDKVPHAVNTIRVHIVHIFVIIGAIFTSSFALVAVRRVNLATRNGLRWFVCCCRFLSHVWFPKRSFCWW